jgi:hypothetical protein
MEPGFQTSSQVDAWFTRFKFSVNLKYLLFFMLIPILY